MSTSSFLSFPTPLVVGDVGGTNVRLACIAAPDAPLESLGHLRTADFPGPGPAIRAAAEERGLSPRSVDGVATGGKVRFTTSFRLQ